MNETEQLKTRIDTALGRIKAQADQVQGLNAKLEAVEARRAKDIEELDTLVEQLKPLVGEA